jgi:hypothetical protein
MLFPVSLVGFEKVRDWECFDADTGKDSAREIREYFIPDFSEWKHHDDYQRGLNGCCKTSRPRSTDTRNGPGQKATTVARSTALPVISAPFDPPCQ